MKRSVTVGNTTIPLNEADAEQLVKEGVLYHCGVEHDLHLNPEGDFELSQVELLLAATVVEK